MNVTDIILRRLNPNYDLTPLFKVRLDYQGGTNVVYIGFAVSGSLTSEPKWIICKFIYDASSNVTQIDVAPENSIWDNRTSLTYS